MTKQMGDLQAHVYKLAGEIGPRGTGTSGEATAAGYVASQLSASGIPFETHTFRAIASQNAFPMAVNGLALLAFALYPFDGRLFPWISAFLALTTAPLLLRAILHSDSPLNPLLPQVTSQNVVGKIKPQMSLQQHAVILAHLDTNRCRLAWQSATVRHIQPLTWLTLGVFACLGLLYLIGALLGGVRWPWVLSLPFIGYVIGAVVTLRRDDRTPFSPGAHDNAASVAVALKIAARLADEPLRNTQVWLAFTGAEETDHAGLKTLLRKYPSIMKDANFIDMEGVGSGGLIYLSQQGVCFPYHPDPGLQSIAQRVAAEHPELGVQTGQMVMEDECRTLRGRGYRAICIAGLDPVTGTLPHWHRSSDLPDTVSEETMQRASGFVMAMLAEIDLMA